MIQQVGHICRRAGVQQFTHLPQSESRLGAHTSGNPRPDASQSFPLQLRAWRERENLSQSEATLKLQISKRTLQEWEQARAAPDVATRVLVEKPGGILVGHIV